MRRRVIALCLGLLVTGIAGCTFPAPRPPEYLDPDTAALITTVSTPIVLARTHNDVAANAQMARHFEILSGSPHHNSVAVATQPTGSMTPTVMSP